MFGGHMKRIGIMGTAIMSLLLAAGVHGHAQQDQPNGKQDRDQKDENRGGPERPQNQPQPSRGEEPRQAERNRGQMQREEQEQRQMEENRWRQEHQRRSEEHTSELQSPCNLVCRLLLEKKKKTPSRLAKRPMRRR